jgi:hypothetical protein
MKSLLITATLVTVLAGMAGAQEPPLLVPSGRGGYVTRDFEPPIVVNPNDYFPVEPQLPTFDRRWGNDDSTIANPPSVLGDPDYDPLSNTRRLRPWQ